jgi:hypothetical protein
MGAGPVFRVQHAEGGATLVLGIDLSGTRQPPTAMTDRIPAKAFLSGSSMPIRNVAS